MLLNAPRTIRAGSRRKARRGDIFIIIVSADHLSSIVNDVRNYFAENVDPEVPILPEPVIATLAA